MTGWLIVTWLAILAAWTLSLAAQQYYLRRWRAALDRQTRILLLAAQHRNTLVDEELDELAARRRR